MNRKLIKPDLRELKKGIKSDKKKPPPPYKTHAENYYYIKQMNNRTPMIITMSDGSVLKGRIEWYDEKCIKYRVDGNKVSFILFKHAIKYIHKDPEVIDENQVDVE